MRAASIAAAKQSDGRGRRHDRHRRLAMTPVHRQEQVGLLGLGRQSCRRSPALHVDDDHRQLHDHSEPERLGLQVHAGAAGAGHGEVSRERGAERDVRRGDLVLGLQRDDAEVLVPAQLVQELGRRRDRVAGIEQREPTAVGGRHQPPRQRGGARDVAVSTGFDGGRGDLVRLGEQLGGLAEVVSRLERGDVRVEDLLLAAELALEPAQRGLGRAVEHPRDQAQREHVLGAFGFFLAEPEVLGGAHRDRGHRHLVHLEALERAVLARIRRVPGLLDVALGERVLVQDEDAPALHRVKVRLQRRGVHGDQHVGVVTGCRDVRGSELDLERRHPVHRAGRRADLRREVRQRGKVVAEHRGRGGEPISRELHAIARVPGESHDEPVFLEDGLGGGLGHASSSVPPPTAIAGPRR